LLEGAGAIEELPPADDSALGIAAGDRRLAALRVAPRRDS
jgi:hypothetical protein